LDRFIFIYSLWAPIFFLPAESAILSQKEMLPFKIALHQACLNRLTQDLERLQKAIDSVQDDANQETKSSAGDKYETSRAMLQMEKDKYTLQYEQFQQLLLQLQALDPNKETTTAGPGSLIQCPDAWYYLAISLGKIQAGDQTAFVLSPESPLGEVLLKKKQGDKFDFRGKKMEILGLW
jgi:transcription elongation GreA/GreB family factor